MSDDPCPKCGLRSCQVAGLVAQIDKLPQRWNDKPLTSVDVAFNKTRSKLERELTVAQDNCDAFSKARKKPS